MRSSGLAALFVGVVSLANCAGPPELERSRARTTMVQAERAQAERYAPSILKAGRNEFEKAETEMVIQLSRPRPFRRFSEARLRFQKADEVLRAALQESLNQQRDFQERAEESLREFDRIGSEMEKQLAQLPAAFIDKEEIDKAISELNVLRREVPAVREKLKSADFRSAYHAASNLRIRGDLLYRETYDRVEQRIVASVH